MGKFLLVTGVIGLFGCVREPPHRTARDVVHHEVLGHRHHHARHPYYRHRAPPPPVHPHYWP